MNLGVKNLAKIRRGGKAQTVAYFLNRQVGAKQQFFGLAAHKLLPYVDGCFVKMPFKGYVKPRFAHTAGICNLLYCVPCILAHKFKSLVDGGAGVVLLG